LLLERILSIDEQYNVATTRIVTTSVDLLRQTPGDPLAAAMWTGAFSLLSYAFVMGLA